MSEGIGYHASSEIKAKKCWSCHSEHHGRDFRIVNFNPNGFDHNKAGFALTGKHSQIKCEDCHQSKYISVKDLKSKKNTYLGLSPKCESCHQDVHQGTLGNNCNSCHNTKAFKPAANFNHDNTKFRLTGEHTKVECIKCHIEETRNGKKFQKFTGLQFSNCTPCHRDPHQGRFGKNCENCHVTSGFNIINQKSFDHNKTNFPLLGKHRFVKCSDCHKQGLKVKLKYQKCMDCHSDFHKGDFTVNGIETDCSKCHTVDGFQPSLFTIDMHNKTRFKLTGSHLAVPCQSCHYKSGNWHFKNIDEQCISCHKNIHGTEITSKFMPDNKCESCHKTDSWSDIKFGHDKTGFSLLGKHAEVKCGDCHYRKNAAGEQVYKFASLSSNCTTCHKDVHFGQFTEGKNTTCQKCHTFNNWKPDKFDHDKTRFSLKGAHMNLDCSACHKTVTKNGNSFVQYKLKDFKCSACHS